jgi:hypothetical protein
VSNVVLLRTGEPIEAQQEEGMLNDMREFMGMVESGHIVQCAVVAISNVGS